MDVGATSAGTSSETRDKAIDANRLIAKDVCKILEVCT
jgi:hypothetical protein